MVNVPTMLVPDKLPPVMLPVADIKPPVSKLPLVVLAVTVNEPNVPTDVTFVCAAVANVPVILVPDKLPPVMLPAADITPPVRILPPVIFAALVIVDVADINPPVNKLPLVVLPTIVAVVAIFTELR